MILIFSCENQSNSIVVEDRTFQKLDKNLSIKLNSQWVKDEAFRIEQYCIRQGWKTKSTNSGLQYVVIEDLHNNNSPKAGDQVIISYDVRLMNPEKTSCYHSDSNGLAKFTIDQSSVESGLHEVVTYLNKGDSALVILPHYLAHGITGDSHKIPPLSSVIYYIKIIDVLN